MTYLTGKAACVQRKRREQAAVSFLALYLVTCTLYGMVITGSCGAFRLKAHRTTQQSIIACSFVLIFVLYGASLALPALAPQFFYYGCQHNCQCEGAEPVANTVLCSDEAVGAEVGNFTLRTVAPRHAMHPDHQCDIGMPAGS